VFPPQPPVEQLSDRELLLDVVWRIRALNDWHLHVNDELEQLHAEDKELRKKVGRDGWLTRAWGVATLLVGALFTHWLTSGRLLP